MALGSSRERMLRKHKKREKSDGVLSKAQGVREARYRKARKLLKNAIAKVIDKKKTAAPGIIRTMEVRSIQLLVIYCRVNPVTRKHPIYHRHLQLQFLAHLRRQPQLRVYLNYLCLVLWN